MKLKWPWLMSDSMAHALKGQAISKAKFSQFFQKQMKLTILSKEHAQDNEFRLVFFGRIEENINCF